MTLRLFAAVLALGFVTVLGRAADDNPYKNAKKDDYATYKLTMKFGGVSTTSTVTETVIDKTEKEATVNVTGSIEVNGTKTDFPPKDQKIKLDEPYDPTKIGGSSGLLQGVDVKIEKGKEGKEKIKVNGKDYDATWTTYTVKGKVGDKDITAAIKAWMTKDVPLGTLKIEGSADVANMKVELALELVETGNKKK